MYNFLEKPYYCMCELSKVCIFYFEQVKDNYLDVGKLFHILCLQFNFYIFDNMFPLTYGTLPTVYYYYHYYFYYYLICTISTKLNIHKIVIYENKLC